jgi:hypothetical protein
MRLIENDLSGDYQFNILVALQRKPIYLGTVEPAEKARRRAANKRAKASRKRNRVR